jgi:hypothetical protein
MLKYQIRNNFQAVTGQSITVSGGTVSGNFKSITIPLNLEFFPVDYGEDVQDIVLSERKKAINPTFDAETTKYTYADNVLANSGQGLILQFRFWNSTASTFNTSYTPAGITTLDINKRRNGFKKSFFRLYFYDTNSGDTNQLIFTEDLDVDSTTQPIIPLNRLYWLRNDEYFIKNNNNRIVYMEASFFNAKTGKVQRFINPPTYITSPLTVAQYSNVSNRDWRTSAIELINPKLNNGEFNFRPYVPFGANNPTVITLTEFIMA